MSEYPYHPATAEELRAWDGDDSYDLLVGPNGFECFLGEPEDRTWRRDAKRVVAELNRLHAALAAERELICAGLQYYRVTGHAGESNLEIAQRQAFNRGLDEAVRLIQQGHTLEDITAKIVAAEREAWARKILPAISHDVRCAFSGCTCGAAANGRQLYADASAAIRAMPNPGS